MKDIGIVYYNDLEEHREEWLRFEKNADLYYFQSYQWLINWFNNIGRSERVRPLIVAVYIDRELSAIFPFCIENKYGVMNVIKWVGEDLADYNAPVFSKFMAEEERTEVTRNVLTGLEKIKGVDLLFLKKVPQYLDNGSINPMINNKVVLPCTHPNDYLYAPFIALSDWESCYMKVSKRIRNDSARRRRMLSEFGALEFRVARDADEVKRITSILIRQKAERLLKIGAKNMFENINYQNFYIRIGLRASNAGYLHLSWLNLNDKVIAVHWGIIFNNRFYYLMPSYDVGYRSFSPGRLLMEDLIRWCCDNRVKYFDFCLGDEKYKNDWTDSKMVLYRFTRPITFKGSIFDKIYRKARPLAKNLRNRIGL